MASLRNSAELAADGLHYGARIRERKEKVISTLADLCPAEITVESWEGILHCINGMPTVSEEGMVSVKLAIHCKDFRGGSSGVNILRPGDTCAKSLVENLQGREGFDIEYWVDRNGDECATVTFQTSNDIFASDIDIPDDVSADRRPRSTEWDGSGESISRLRGRTRSKIGLSNTPPPNSTSRSKPSLGGRANM